MTSSDENADQTASRSVAELRALAQRAQAALEQQRTRLAQELHDHLTQKLTVVSLELSLLDSGLSSEQGLSGPKLREKVKELSFLVQDAIQSLRKIKAELRPKLLDEFGLIAALEWETAEFQRKTGLQCTFSAIPDDVRLEPHVATELFRMFQGILANVMDHARASHVTVKVREDGPQLHLRVSDDGAGITQEAIESPASLGLLELRERTAAVRGELQLEGSPGRGTTVAIKVPLKS
jgi:signal transduction histidine kinase